MISWILLIHNRTVEQDFVCKEDCRKMLPISVSQGQYLLSHVQKSYSCIAQFQTSWYSASKGTVMQL